MGCWYNDNVAGLSGNRHWKQDDVAGASDCHHKKRDDDFKVRVEAFIDSEEFCRAVRRCLADDVAGAETDRRRKRRHYW
ncbi:MULTISPECIES: hypothetical protein [Bacillaceae]|uniref:Uncharacterized protein n=2 Tax=Bacillus infantis TaxID=324767 RepID=U5LEZ2_9BACI|nr:MULTISPECIES: hypothetical protein [Bacillus]OXT15491.1 hypothetical protein B9K06_20460 [Bacillus sp. OG2]AGX06030.1 hypothetical protein N288_20920 [Bacillus infantis NRRL B-14911]MCA1033921.1 hypothetical protein [Bacillus infantis]MCK6207617.1 hypothetical protein [Bacillus infantis]MCP1160276.1 hypothetical protein [Bacillus infantis]